MDSVQVQKTKMTTTPIINRQRKKAIDNLSEINLCVNLLDLKSLKDNTCASKGMP